MMGQINVGTLKDFNDGEYVHGNDLDQVFEIIRTAINDNYNKLVDRYTKAEVDGLLYNGGIGVASSIAVATTLPAPTIQGKFLLKSPENIAYYCTGAAWIQITTAGDLSAVQTSLNTTITNHTGNTSNPHGVTTSQIGAIPLSQKAAASGVASLNSSGQVTQTAIDALAIDGQRVGKMKAGDYFLYGNATVISSSSASYIKLRSAKVYNAGTYRVKFDMKITNLATAYGRIYVNGIAVGTERTTTSASYVTFTEDITVTYSNDTIEIYVHTSDGVQSLSLANFVLTGAVNDNTLPSTIT